MRMFLWCVFLFLFHFFVVCGVFLQIPNTCKSITITKANLHSLIWILNEHLQILDEENSRKLNIYNEN